MRKLLELFEQSSPPDYTSIAQIWLRLNEPALAASTLSKLVTEGAKDNDKLLEAYQIGFDLADTATQEFLGKVIDALPKTEEQEKESEPTALHALKEILSGEKSIRLYLEFLSKNNHSDLLLLKNIKVCTYALVLACLSDLLVVMRSRTLWRRVHPSSIRLSPSPTPSRTPVQHLINSFGTTWNGLVGHLTGPCLVLPLHSV